MHPGHIGFPMPPGYGGPPVVYPPGHHVGYTMPPGHGGPPVVYPPGPPVGYPTTYGYMLGIPPKKHK